MGIKALAIKVLQGNQRGNRKETQSFLANKNRKPERGKGKLLPVVDLSRWQQDFCQAHADLNNWRGCCPRSIEDCLISKILDSQGKIDNLRKLEIANGIDTDDVIQLWQESDDPPVADPFKNPLWFICMAEHIARHR